MALPDSETEELMERAGRGDALARQELLVRHQARLRQMIAVRMDRRLGARLDPSDVVQEVFADACQKLSDYLQRRPLPFYPWLRQLAWERLVKLHQRHIQAQKRSTTREQHDDPELSDESVLALANRLLASGSLRSSNGASWAITALSARSAAVAWGSSTRRNRSRWAAR